MNVPACDAGYSIGESRWRMIRRALVKHRAGLPFTHEDVRDYTRTSLPRFEWMVSVGLFVPTENGYTLSDLALGAAEFGLIPSDRFMIMVRSGRDPVGSGVETPNTPLPTADSPRMAPRKRGRPPSKGRKTPKK